MEEALHDMPPYREFARLDAGIARLPDERTILRFRRLLQAQAHALSLQLKASVRAKVEHPFRVVKRQFGYVKVRYRGLANNTAQSYGS